MAYKSLQRRIIFLLLIFNSQTQIIIGQVLQKTDGSTKADSPSASGKPGINLSDSFFIQRLRQGKSGAINDFNNLRQTLVIPEDQQKQFTIFLQQQNPLNRFALWNTMQNVFIHGYPNSRALNRMGSPIGNMTGGQQMLPAQQLLNILQQARAENQHSDVNKLTPGLNRTVTSNVQDVVLKEVNIKPIASEAMFTAPVKSQINPIIPLTGTVSQLGQLELDQIRNVLRTKVNENALEHTMSLIEQVLRNRAANQSGINGAHKTPAETMTNGNSADVMQLPMTGAPNDFTLQYVGDMLDPSFVNTYDVAPLPNGFINKDIVSKSSQPELVSDMQRTIQFVGNIFGNNGIQSLSGVDLGRGNENEVTRSTTFDPSVTSRLDSTVVFGNNAEAVINSNVADTPNVQTSDVYLQYVGDLTGADLMGAGKEINSLTGELNPKVTKLFSDSPSVGMRGNIVSTSETDIPQRGPRLSLARQMADIVRNGGMKPVFSRDLYLQKVGNFLADQLTPIDGALTAYNETSLNRFVPSAFRNTDMLQTSMGPVQPNSAVLPIGRRQFTEQRIANNLIGNREQFQHRNNMNLAHILNRQQQRFRGSPWWLSTENNRDSEEPKKFANAQNTKQDRQSVVINKSDPAEDKSSEPAIETIVKLLRSLTNKSGGDSGATIQQTVSDNKQHHNPHSSMSPNHKIPVLNAESDKTSFPNDINGRLQTSVLGRGAESFFGAFQNTNDMLVTSNSVQAQSNAVRASLPIKRLTNDARVGGPTIGGLLPRTIDRGKFSRNENLNNINARPNSNFKAFQIVPRISSAQTFQNLLRASTNLQTSGTQTERNTQTTSNDTVFRERHKDSMMDKKTLTTYPQGEQFSNNEVNKTLTSQTDQLVKSKTPKTGIETGFILVNRLFVTDNTKDSINTANNNGLKGSEVKTVIRRNELDPRTGETFNIVVGARPSGNVNKHSDNRQAAKSNC